MEPNNSEYFADLFVRIARSEKSAFDELFRSLYPVMVLFACRYVDDKSTASDITQDAFIKIWQKRENLSEVTQAKSYIYRMVRNLSLNYIRDHSKTDIGLETEFSNVLNMPRNEWEPDSAAEETHESQMKQLLNWICKLPDRQREAFELSRFEGLDHHEIAEVMNVSARTVNNHIVEALKNLQRMRDMHSKKKILTPYG